MSQPNAVKALFFALVALAAAHQQGGASMSHPAEEIFKGAAPHDQAAIHGGGPDADAATAPVTLMADTPQRAESRSSRVRQPADSSLSAADETTMTHTG